MRYSQEMPRESVKGHEGSYRKVLTNHKELGDMLIDDDEEEAIEGTVSKGS